MVTKMRHGLVATAASVMLMGAWAAPGTALGDLPTAPGGPLTPPTGGETYDDVKNEQSKRQTVKEGNTSCHLVSSPNYIGGQCIDVNGDAGGSEPTIEELLAGDPLPECWDIPLTEREREGLLLMNSDSYVWYWHKCLEGIDPVTFEVSPKGATVWTGVVLYPRNPAPGQVVTLTPNQVKVVERYTGDTMIPNPIMGVSPNGFPIVNQDTSFFNYGTDQVQVAIGDTGVQMRAHIVKTQVLPTGRNPGGNIPVGKMVSCDGTGYKAQPGETRADHEGCWYIFKDSSLTQADKKFKAEIHTTWEVEVQMPGQPWRHFNTFTKGSYWLLGVDEVQVIATP